MSDGSPAFFDTNILLYAYGGEDTEKRRRAKALLREYRDSNLIIVSTQVIQEFYAVGSRKVDMPQRELRQVTVEFLKLPLVIVGPSEIRAALEIQERYQLSFWDALIVAAAEVGGAEVLFTEHLNDGQRYGGVLARNPFRST